MWDWSVCSDESTRYENMVAASHLLKFCHLWEDARGEEMALQFIRNAQGKEIDFVVVKNQKPWFAVEVKQTIANSANKSPIMQSEQTFLIFSKSTWAVKTTKSKNIGAAYYLSTNCPNG